MGSHWTPPDKLSVDDEVILDPNRETFSVDGGVFWTQQDKLTLLTMGPLLDWGPFYPARLLAG